MTLEEFEFYLDIVIGIGAFAVVVIFKIGAGHITNLILRSRGYNYSWFWFGFFFDWLAWIVAAMKPNIKEQEKTIDKTNSWKCKDCGEWNPTYKNFCSCGKSKY